MDNGARAALHRVVAAHGAAVAQDSRALAGMLAHVCPQLRIECEVLVAAVSVGVPEELYPLRGRTAGPDLLDNLSARLASGFGFAAEEARWAVESWAAALGVRLSNDTAPVPPAPPPTPAPPAPMPRATAPPDPSPPAVIVVRERPVRPRRPAPSTRGRSRAEVVLLVSAVVVGACILGGAVVVGLRASSSASSAADGGRGGPDGAASDVPADWVAYRDPQTGFAMSYPPGWQIRIDGNTTDFFDPVSRAYLRVDHRPDTSPRTGGNPAGAWYELEASFAKTYADYRRVQIVSTTYRGADAALWEFTYTDGSTRLHAYDLGFFTGRAGFALNFQSHAEDWQRLNHLFETFKLAFGEP